MDIEIVELDAKGLRRFAITLGLAVAVIFGVVLPFLFGFNYPTWPWIIAAVLIGWGLVAPSSLQAVYKGWMRFALLINKVTTPLVLGIVFVFLILPIGFVFKIFGRDIMHRRFDAGAKSYRDGVDEHSVNDLERPF